jgi:hypothetical protein
MMRTAPGFTSHQSTPSRRRSSAIPTAAKWDPVRVEDGVGAVPPIPC